MVGPVAVGLSAWLGSYELSGRELLPFAGPAIVPVAHHDARRYGAGTVSECLRTAVTSVIRRPRIRIRVGPAIQPAEYAGRTVHETVSLAHERVTAGWRTLSA